MHNEFNTDRASLEVVDTETAEKFKFSTAVTESQSVIIACDHIDYTDNDALPVISDTSNLL